MLDHDIRLAIMLLRREGHGFRAIARILNVSRNSVRRVLENGQTSAPKMERTETLAPFLDRLRVLYIECRGNLVRVHEELAARDGVQVPYSSLTAFCRRHGIGPPPKQPSGRYHFSPGQEMQHDTSPHTVQVGGRALKLQCASLVLCYSRRIFAQVYPAFRRFHCKAFLTEALQHFGGSAERCMIDNTSVVLAHGSGSDAVPAPEMAAFGKRFGFVFVAHEVGDANRSARVERNFHYIENNFYPGRSFADLRDLNEQLRSWCVERDHKVKAHLQARPIELFAAEQVVLKPLPPHIPEVYDLHERAVDSEGYFHLHRNRYSVPEHLLGQRVEVREGLERVRVFYQRRLVVEHDLLPPGLGKRTTHPDQRRHRPKARRQWQPLPEEQVLRAADEDIRKLIDALRQRHGGRAVRPIRQLYRIYLDYPTEPLVFAVRRANQYGLLDLNRIEQMVLSNTVGDFFRLPTRSGFPDTEDHDA